MTAEEMAPGNDNEPMVPLADGAEERQPPDRLNEIGVLTRREIEARIIGPLVDALGEEFGRERVIEVVRRVIVRLARDAGNDMAETEGGRTIGAFAHGFEAWKKGGALETEILEENEQAFSFNVTRCRYAELYRSLGIPELGATLSCNRDFALIQGFNPDISLVRAQTIMEGAPFCDFRYRAKRKRAGATLRQKTRDASDRVPESS